jgi:hypothetical protein
MGAVLRRRLNDRVARLLALPLPTNMQRLGVREPCRRIRSEARPYYAEMITVLDDQRRVTVSGPDKAVPLQPQAWRAGNGFLSAVLGAIAPRTADKAA